MQQDFQCLFQAPKAICHIFLLLPTAFMFLTKKKQVKEKRHKNIIFFSANILHMYCARWFKHFLTHFSKLFQKKSSIQCNMNIEHCSFFFWKKNLQEKSRARFVCELCIFSVDKSDAFISIQKAASAAYRTIFCAFINFYKIYKNWKYFAFLLFYTLVLLIEKLWNDNEIAKRNYNNKQPIMQTKKEAPSGVRKMNKWTIARNTVAKYCLHFL